MIGFTGANVDRADHLRLDEARLAELAAHQSAQIMRLDGLNPVLDEEGRIAGRILGGATTATLYGVVEDVLGREVAS